MNKTNKIILSVTFGNRREKCEEWENMLLSSIPEQGGVVGQGQERDAVHRVRQRDPAEHRRAEQGQDLRRDQQDRRR